MRWPVDLLNPLTSTIGSKGVSFDMSCWDVYQVVVPLNRVKLTLPTKEKIYRGTPNGRKLFIGQVSNESKGQRKRRGIRMPTGCGAPS
jgi:hypothetical protein